MRAPILGRVWMQAVPGKLDEVESSRVWHQLVRAAVTSVTVRVEAQPALFQVQGQAWPGQAAAGVLVQTLRALANRARQLVSVSQERRLAWEGRVLQLRVARQVL